MDRRTFVFLLGTLAGTVALAGCAGGGGVPQPGFTGGFGAASAPAPQGRRVAILLPLGGANAAIGQAMLNAAQLALGAPGNPPLDPIDTGGTAAGAAAAARQAVGSGAGLILGPLTATETAAAAPVARAAGVAVLAFTNDAAQAQPGVWVLGITALQQTHRLAALAQAQGRGRLAALLPDSAFGRAMGTGLTQAATGLGLAPPAIRFYGEGFAAINQAARDLSGYAERRGPIDAQIRAARARGDADGRREAAELARQPVPPPPFDTLLLAETGERLTEVLSLLPYYDLDPPQVQVLGPSLWAADTAHLAAQRGIGGAWFAAPDPDARAAFEQAYAGRYGASPPTVADIAFDAAGIARSAAQSGGFGQGSLTRPDGFPGADGKVALRPDGTVQRGLAVLQLGQGGAHVLAPAGPAAPGA